MDRPCVLTVGCTACVSNKVLDFISMGPSEDGGLFQRDGIHLAKWGKKHLYQQGGQPREESFKLGAMWGGIG